MVAGSEILTDFVIWQKKNEFVNAFCFLGVTLSTQNVTTAHHKIREEKRIQQVNHLAAKVDLQIINFMTAEKLLHSLILPPATYGLSPFIKEPDFLKSVSGYFWKRWARISEIYVNNTTAGTSVQPRLPRLAQS